MRARATALLASSETQMLSVCTSCGLIFLEVVRPCLTYLSMVGAGVDPVLMRVGAVAQGCSTTDRAKGLGPTVGNRNTD